MDSRLELNTSVLKEKQENDTSLTDLNNLQLFTDAFQGIMEEEKRRQEIEDSNLAGCCFTGREKEDAEESVIRNMFQAGQVATVKKSSQTVDYGNSFILLGSILIGLIICILVFEITNRRKVDKNDVDINNRTEE